VVTDNGSDEACTICCAFVSEVAQLGIPFGKFESGNPGPSIFLHKKINK